MYPFALPLFIVLIALGAVNLHLYRRGIERPAIEIIFLNAASPLRRLWIWHRSLAGPVQFFTVCGLLLSIAALFLTQKKEISIAQLGTSGDYVGGWLNPLVGLLSIILLLRNLEQQNKQIEKSEQLLSQQNAMLAQQALEQTFFAWLSTYRETLAMVSCASTQGRLLLGAAALDEVFKVTFRPHFEAKIGPVLVGKLVANQVDINRTEAAIALRAARECWRRVLLDDPTVVTILTSFFRLIRWIDEQPNKTLPLHLKWHYISIVRSQLTRGELHAILVSGTDARGKRTVPLIEKYALLDNYLRQSRRITGWIGITGQPWSIYKDAAFDSGIARSQLDLPENYPVRP